MAIYRLRRKVWEEAMYTGSARLVRMRERPMSEAEEPHPTATMQGFKRSRLDSTRAVLCLTTTVDRISLKERPRSSWVVLLNTKQPRLRRVSQLAPSQGH